MTTNTMHKTITGNEYNYNNKKKIFKRNSVCKH